MFGLAPEHTSPAAAAPTASLTTHALTLGQLPFSCLQQSVVSHSQPPHRPMLNPDGSKFWRSEGGNEAVSLHSFKSRSSPETMRLPLPTLLSNIDAMLDTA
jgi:hypothetical protein